MDKYDYHYHTDGLILCTCTRIKFSKIYQRKVLSKEIFIREICYLLFIYFIICFYSMKYTISNGKRYPFLSQTSLIRINIFLLAFYYERGRRMGNPNSVPR